jgi:group I intron endonuclease
MTDSFYKLGGIYSIVHIESGRPYVGSAVLFFKRWSEHRMNLRRNKHPNQRLQNFWNKYGEDAFEFKIIEVIENPTKELLESREQYWIDFYNSADREIGFNIRKISSSNLGFKHTEETKQKMRLAHLGKKQSPEHIKNAAESHRGKKRTAEQAKRCARTWTPEQRKQRSEQQKQIFQRDGMSEETRQKCREAALEQWKKQKQI